MKKETHNKEQFLTELHKHEAELETLGITTNVIQIIHNIKKEGELAELNRGNMTLSCISVLSNKNKEELKKIITENNFDNLISVISKTIAHVESAT